MIQYWSQIAVIISLLINLMLIVLNYRIGQKEIIYSKIKENKIEEFKKLIRIYCPLHWRLSTMYFQLESNGIKDKDEQFLKLRESLMQIEEQGMIVKLFLLKEEQQIIDNLNSLINECRAGIQTIDRKQSTKRDIEFDSCDTLQDKITKTLPMLFDSISNQISNKLNF